MDAGVSHNTYLRRDQCQIVSVLWPCGGLLGMIAQFLVSNWRAIRLNI